ncbi:hypothetical protein BH09VER1_BH09VER1_18950 [soil metagenome]
MTCSLLVGAGYSQAMAQEHSPVQKEILISVAEQRLAIVENGEVVEKYPISTSRFGVGDGFGTYKTPVGHLKICEKMGTNLPAGAVLKNRRVTGEILPVNAPGRDPIVTRILWLEGTDSCNQNARQRGIYIHGTPVERLIGKPASYGCIRMRSRDVVEVYNLVAVGTPVTIVTEKLPRLRNAERQPPGDMLIDNRRAASPAGPIAAR